MSFDPLVVPIDILRNLPRYSVETRRVDSFSAKSSLGYVRTRIPFPRDMMINSAVEAAEVIVCLINQGVTHPKPLPGGSEQ
ncbi:uncharacterized protein L203_101469 [Cryptococcus depauperatus CBS 7841]|uniref:Uncharacterized protein n=1 Tax=Cryptococcus depauperatus CBS 7841 TaxID=1295531 RepID=A0AAJ8JQ50_9TREE